jgi:adenosyl cobinamide kinase/adenosyl cobinamide phosphate guanylyltransferase
MMTTVEAIADNFKKFQNGVNWTAVNLRQVLDGVDWVMATTEFSGCNTIAVLTYHINYYVDGVNKFLETGQLEIRDKFSFDCPSISSEEDWQQLLQKTYADMDLFHKKVLKLQDEVLSQVFLEEKYGSYFRNLTGIIEHGHYHLGQIVILKKILTAQATQS